MLLSTHFIWLHLVVRDNFILNRRKVRSGYNGAGRCLFYCAEMYGKQNCV